MHPDAYSAERTLAHAKEACEKGWLAVDPGVYDQLVAMGIPLEEAGDAIRTAMLEVTADHPKTPDFAFDPPGQGFFWQSAYFNCQMYLKVRLEDSRPRCKLYSLHEPVHPVTPSETRRSRRRS